MRLWFGVLAVGCAMAGLWFFFFKDTRPEGEKIVEAAHEALLTRDAEGLLGLASEEEVRALGLTEKKLQRFIDEYVLVEYEGMKVAQADVVEDRPDAQGVHTLVRTYTTPDGRVARFAFFSRERDEGPYLDHMVWSLFFGRMLEGMSRESMTGEQVVLLWAETMERDGDRLTEMGIPGVYMTHPEGHQFLTWKEFAKTRRDALAKVEAVEKAAAGSKK